MFRARRYRVLLVFAAVFVLTFLHFARSRDWSATIIESPGALNPNTPPVYPKPAADDTTSKFAPAAPDHGPPGGSKQPEKLESPVVPGSSKGDTNKITGSTAYDNGYDKSSQNTGSKESTPESSSDGTSMKTPEADLSQNPDSQVLLEEQDQGGPGRAIVKPQPGKPQSYWRKFPERFPVPANEVIKLPNGQAKTVPKLQAKFKDESTVDKQERLQQLSTIKEEFSHAWAGYKKVAFGHDEVRPLSAAVEDPFNGWGATLVDALDTLWIMELKEEFSEAVDMIKKIDFTTSARENIPVFETVIRYLGGLLGAYDISGQRYSVLLEKAEELAGILMGAFDTPNRMPVLYYRWTP